MERDQAGNHYQDRDRLYPVQAEEETKAIKAIKQMNESYRDQVKALQKAAGIQISEEVSGYQSGFEMEEEYDVYEDGTDPDETEYSESGVPMEEEVGSIQDLDSAIASIKSAQAVINGLIGKQDLGGKGKHKQKLQVLSQELNNIQGALSNLASGNVKKKEKVLKP